VAAIGARILPNRREDRQQFCFHSRVDVTVLGLGEAGSRIAADLVALGVQVHGYDPLVTDEQPGVALAGDPAAAVVGSTVILAVTTAATAEEAARSAVPGLRAGALYADLATAAPGLKRRLAAVVAEGGAQFADVALLGPVPATGVGTPTLASGPGAEAFAHLFGPFGMPVEVVSDRPGDAAARKLLRSVFMKGLAASVLESRRAAEAAGQGPWLDEEIAAVVGRPLLERLVHGSRRHASRRVDEMLAAGELLLELGIEPRIASASASVLSGLAEEERAPR
jgi:3-hydroxyisobutyrate dehydrogenase-like beta-hydroxyacid dehydrogenase